MIGDAEPKCFEARGDGLADAPEPEDADRASAQGRGERVILLQPFSGAQIPVDLRQLPHRGDEEPHREIGHFLGQNVGRVGDHDAAPRRLGGVDAVVADAEIGNDLEIGHELHHGAVDAARAAGGEAPDARSRLAQHLLETVVRPAAVQRELPRDAVDDERHHGARHEHFDFFQQRSPPGGALTRLSCGGLA
jgi:hypothetical protein